MRSLSSQSYMLSTAFFLIVKVLYRSKQANQLTLRDVLCAEELCCVVIGALA